MKWIVDRIEENLAILENEETKQKKEIDISTLPFLIKEGSILIEKNQTYLLDIENEQKKRKEIKDKFERLRSRS